MLDMLVFVSCVVIILSELFTAPSRVLVTMELANEAARAKRLNDEMQSALEAIQSTIVTIKGEEIERS